MQIADRDGDVVGCYPHREGDSSPEVDDFSEIVCSMILEENWQRTGRGDRNGGCREGRRHPGREVKRLNRKGQLLSMSNAVRMRSGRG